MEVSKVKEPFFEPKQPQLNNLEEVSINGYSVVAGGVRLLTVQRALRRGSLEALRKADLQVTPVEMVYNYDAFGFSVCQLYQGTSPLFKFLFILVSLITSVDIQRHLLFAELFYTHWQLHYCSSYHGVAPEIMFLSASPKNLPLYGEDQRNINFVANAWHVWAVE